MHEFPLILKHRSDPHQQIVVANAEQLNSVSDDFAPDEIRKNRKEGAADVGVSVAEKSIGKSGDGSQAEGRDKSLGEDALATARKQLQDEADAISEKHKKEREQIAQERKQLEQARQSFEQQQAALSEKQQERAQATAGEQKNDDSEEKIPGNRPELGQSGHNGKQSKKG